jgi:hypothetical protein
VRTEAVTDVQPPSPRAAQAHRVLGYAYLERAAARHPVARIYIASMGHNFERFAEACVRRVRTRFTTAVHSPSSSTGGAADLPPACSDWLSLWIVGNQLEKFGSGERVPCLPLASIFYQLSRDCRLASVEVQAVAKLPRPPKHAVLKFIRFHYLNFGDRLTDGFFDGGRAFEVAIDNDECTVGTIENILKAIGLKREVLIVDALLQFGLKTSHEAVDRCGRDNATQLFDHKLSQRHDAVCERTDWGEPSFGALHTVAQRWISGRCWPNRAAFAWGSSLRSGWASVVIAPSSSSIWQI